MAAYFFTVFVSVKYGLYGMSVCGAKLIGIGLLLFRQEKQGFYLFVGAGVLDVILCLAGGAGAVNIVMALIGTACSAAITYLLMRKSEGVFQ